MDYQKNMRYFNGVDHTISTTIMSLGGVLVFAGIFVLIASIVGGIVLIVVGVLATVGGIYYRGKEEEKLVSDEQYDDSVGSMLSNIQAKAMEKLGIDEDEVKEIAPISFGGYKFQDAHKVKKGDDGLYRSNIYESVVLFFSKNEVHCYVYDFNTIYKKQTEATSVYFYNDIVSVSTASDSVQVQNINIDYECFKLITTGGTALTVSLRNINDAQRSINAMRSLIKSKKQG